METIVDKWNKMPSGVMDANTLGSFKHSSEKFMNNVGWLGVKKSCLHGQQPFCSFFMTYCDGNLAGKFR